VYGFDAPFTPVCHAFMLSTPSSMSSTPLPPPAMSEGTLPGGRVRGESRGGCAHALKASARWPPARQRTLGGEADEAADRHQGAVRQRHAEVVHLGVAGLRGGGDEALSKPIA
jgi:hypothetical protein